MLTLDELVASGLSERQVQLRVLRGSLHRQFAGVYLVGHPVPTMEGRFVAAVKTCGPGAALSIHAAGATWGFREWREGAIDISVDRPTRSRQPGIRVHRTTWLERRDLRMRNGILVTSPERTIVDLAAVLSFRELRRAVRQAMSMRLVNLRTLIAVLERAGPRRGVRNLRRILADGYTPTRSELEDIVLDLIVAAGLERPEVNAPLVLDGRRVVPDFRWPEHQIVVEADGAAWHENKVAREDDAERQALLEGHGERVVRITWDQAVAQPSQTQRRLHAAGIPPRVVTQ